MGLKRVVVTAPDQVRLMDYQQARPGPDDVLVKVEVCGICGSDLSYIAGGGMPGVGAAMPLGHELAGVVTEVGGAVSGVEPGDRVVVNPTAAGNAIGNGGPEGGFAPWLLVRNANRDRCLYRLPDSLSFEYGALVEPLGVAMHAVNQAEVTPDSRVVVFGAGPIGLGVVAVLKDRGVNNVIAIDLSPYRLAVAAQLGARSTHLANADVWAAIGRDHGTDSLHGQPVIASDVFIDAAGAGANVRGVFDHAGLGARLVVVAMHKAEIALPFFQVMAKELIIKGSMAYPDEFSDVLELLTAGRVDIAPLVSHRYPLDEFDVALGTARRTDESAKVLVTM